MRKSEAKERILRTAEEAIRDKGYTTLNVNDIAYLAKVSIGTLYYHFPDGKTSILAELLSNMQQRALEVKDKLLVSKDLQRKSFDESLGNLLLVVLKQRRKDRHFLAAVQIEMLADLSKYEEVVKSFESKEAMHQGWKEFVDFIGILSKSFPNESIDISGFERRIERTIGTLMTYQIMFPNYLGSDDEFVQTLVGIVRVIVG